MKLIYVLLFLIIFSFELFSQVGRNFKVTEYGILNYADSKNVVTESVLKDKPRMDNTHLPPQLKIFAPKEQNLEADTSKKSELVGTRGTRFVIPENAFVDMTGNLVEGVVTVTVIEIIDELDFLTSGIGLIYYSKYGKELYLISGGIFKIEYKLGDQKVKLAPGKIIEVQFPDISPKETFSLYHMDESGVWNLKSSLSNNDRIEAGTNDRDNYEGRKIVGVRIAQIDKPGYWNFAYPELQHTCLKGTIDDSKSAVGNELQLTVIALDVRGFFTRTVKDKEFSINSYKKRNVKVLVIDEKGNLGLSSQITSSDKNGSESLPDSPDNFKQSIGSIELKKIPTDIWGDEKSFRQLLSFPQERYFVRYRK
ncbi:MAG: hypothetical protein KBF93_03885 [Leptospiraceae bacterium]|nr:hypothetical protein [Leptospiraceae bacterium]